MDSRIAKVPEWEKAFAELKSLSTACLEDPGLLSVSNYRNFLSRPEIDSNFLRPILKFAMVPMQVIITKLPEVVQLCKTPTSYEQLLLLSLDCIAILLSKVAPLTDGSIFEVSFTLFITILDQGGSNSTSDPLSKSLIRLSDDSRLALLGHLNTLLVICDHSVFNAKLLNDSQFKFKIGFFINVLLKLVKTAKYFKIQSSALNLLSLFFLKSLSLNPLKESSIIIHPGNETNDCVIKLTAFTLPSIVSTITSLISVCSGGGNHYKLHSSVIIAALKLLEILVTITFNIRQTFDEIEAEDNCTEKDKLSKLPEVKFTQFWFDKTSENLCLVLRSIFEALLEHPDVSVCSTLQKVASRLIFETCTSFMLRCIHIVIRVPIAHVEDPQFSIQFKEFTSKLTKADFDALHSILENELLSHINQTQKVISEDSLLYSLRILSGFFQIITPESLLLVPQHKFELFRLLIQLAQFEYKQELQRKTVVDYDDYVNISGGDLIEVCSLHQYLRYLNTAQLVQAYRTVVHQLLFNENNIHAIYDYLTELVLESQFDPTVLLLFNCILSGITNQTVPSLRHYLDELLKLFSMQIDLSALQQFHEAETRELEEILRPLSISQLSTICAVPSSLPSSSSTSADYEPTKSKSEKHLIYQQCLLLQGTTIIYSLLYHVDLTTKALFFRHRFCFFVEAFSSEIHLVSVTAEKMLLFLGKKFQCGDGKIESMVLENLDYLYSSMTVALDYDILRHNDKDDNRFDTVYRLDTYSLETVQVALQTILRLLGQLHRSSKSVDLKDLDYLHRLMDQILNVIKYYSIHPLPRYTANLNRLLIILCSYLELVEVVCDQDAQFSRRIEGKTQEEKIASTTAFLEEFISNVLFMRAQSEIDFDDDKIGDDVDESKILKDVTGQANKEEAEKRSILESPIVKSRVADILNQCSFILSDANVDIRLNVLLLACKSMKLLRSFEDLLLPYVHKLWGPLVARFNVESDHPLVLSRAYGCLLQASEFCGDFLLSRTCKEVLPRLVAFLHAQLDHRIVYFTTNRRLLTVKSVEYFAEYELLRTIGLLASNLKLRSTELWTICPLLMMFTSLRPVPPELQKCAFESLVELARYDSGSVRFYLHRMENLCYDSREQSASSESCDCQRNTSVFEECTTTWKKYCQRWDNSLLRDLKGHLSAL